MNNKEMKGSIRRPGNFAKLFRVTEAQFHLQVIGPGETRDLASADKPAPMWRAAQPWLKASAASFFWR
ncbi:MAG TPA: hypothetical protein VF208_11875 [Candidatus Binatia bacterium]